MDVREVAVSAATIIHTRWNIPINSPAYFHATMWIILQQFKAELGAQSDDIKAREPKPGTETGTW